MFEEKQQLWPPPCAEPPGKACVLLSWEAKLTPSLTLPFTLTPTATLPITLALNPNLIFTLTLVFSLLQDPRVPRAGRSPGGRLRAVLQARVRAELRGRQGRRRAGECNAHIPRFLKPTP